MGKAGTLNMIDRYGREIDYIRISVTDRCNLRCVYCMPEEGILLTSHREILRFHEIVHLAGIFASAGIRKIKLTGGEPLVRLQIEQLVKELKGTEGIEQVTLTTNGTLLREKAEALVQAGIDGVNISLNSLDPEEYRQITRKEELDKVWEGFQEMRKYPEVPVKINCVSMEQSPSGICRTAAIARDYPVHVRFIEMMPIGLGESCKGRSEEELLQILEKEFGSGTPITEKLGNGPCHYVQFAGFQGKIAVTSAMSHKFCDRCNRIRLTSQGYLKTCLQYDRGVDLREPLRTGASDHMLRELILQAVSHKPASHAFTEKVSREREEKFMSQIGG